MTTITSTGEVEEALPVVCRKWRLRWWCPSLRPNGEELEQPDQGYAGGEAPASYGSGGGGGAGA